MKELIAGLFVLLLVALLGATLGAISIGTTGLILAGGLYLLDFVAIGLAKTIFIGIAAVGAIVGGLFASVWVLGVGAMMG